MIDLFTTSFKNIEKEINNVINNDFDDIYSTDMDYIKKEIYSFIKYKFSYLNITTDSIKENRFYIQYDYMETFMGIKDYNKMTIKIYFTIKCKKTSELVKVSETRNSYVYTNKKNCIKFGSCNIKTSLNDFDFENKDDNSNINLIVSPYRIYDEGVCYTDKEKCVNDLLETFSYKDNFINYLVNPWVKNIMLKGRKYNEILRSLDKDTTLKQQVLDKKFEFKDLAYFILNNNYIF